ncbi:MAG TPA: PIG-L deacetylase family protein [Geminicoccaceae bacterium]|nr:PIG-L deacetylase family protein [Geminicoccaceae bacterium]
MAEAAAGLAGSALADPAALPPLPYAALDGFGPTLVAAPHPDDETLGSGGLIALLRERGVPVRVLVLTDGTGSHPNSRAYPAPRLRALREAETLAAAGHLGLDPDAVTFLREPDGRPAVPGEPGYPALLARCRAHLDAHGARTLVVTWRRDPHPDHRAAWRVMTEAAAGAALRPLRVLEVPIWLWHHPEPGDAPVAGEAGAWRLDVSPVLARKRAAGAAHRSLTTGLIADDPRGFPLPPALLARLQGPHEVYLEAPV